MHGTVVGPRDVALACDADVAAGRAETGRRIQFDAVDEACVAGGVPRRRVCPTAQGDVPAV